MFCDAIKLMFICIHREPHSTSKRVVEIESLSLMVYRSRHMVGDDCAVLVCNQYTRWCRAVSIISFTLCVFLSPRVFLTRVLTYLPPPMSVLFGCVRTYLCACFPALPCPSHLYVLWVMFCRFSLTLRPLFSEVLPTVPTNVVLSALLSPCSLWSPFCFFHPGTQYCVG